VGIGCEFRFEFDDDEPHAVAARASSPSVMNALGDLSMERIVRIRPEHLLNGVVRGAASRYLTDMTGASVLVLEDDAQLLDVLVRSLRAEGFAPRGVPTAHELLERIAGGSPDAFVIDIGLPDADGRDVCQALRAQGVHAPVLFLTARDALPDRLAGFRAGGDDYLTKPFDLDELFARLEALIRRSVGERTIDAANLQLDPTERTAARDGASVTLTPTEFRLLATLASRAGRATTRSQLIRSGWPHGAIVHDNTLDVYVARIRRKLRDLPGAPAIVTVHGAGYRLQ
jgi:two-component system response regulator MprA